MEKLVYSVEKLKEIKKVIINKNNCFDKKDFDKVNEQISVLENKIKILANDAKMKEEAKNKINVREQILAEYLNDKNLQDLDIFKYFVERQIELNNRIKNNVIINQTE